MKHIINKEDIKNIKGKWIIQLANNEQNFSLLESKNDEFWLEKRIYFVGYLYGSDAYPTLPFQNDKKFIILNGLYYTHGIFEESEFIDYFNNYINGERFHRLLTSNELDWLNNHLKKNLY